VIGLAKMAMKLAVRRIHGVLPSTYPIMEWNRGQAPLPREHAVYRSASTTLYYEIIDRITRGERP
jgi:hypothetical protein